MKLRDDDQNQLAKGSCASIKCSIFRHVRTNTPIFSSSLKSLCRLFDWEAPRPILTLRPPRDISGSMNGSATLGSGHFPYVFKWTVTPNLMSSPLRPFFSPTQMTSPLSAPLSSQRSRSMPLILRRGASRSLACQRTALSRMKNGFLISTNGEKLTSSSLLYENTLYSLNLVSWRR